MLNTKTNYQQKVKSRLLAGKKVLLLATIIFSMYVLPAQTLVNREIVVETGKPHLLLNFACGGVDSNGNAIIASNTVSNYLGEVIHVAKFNANGEEIWQHDYEFDTTDNIVAVTDMTIVGTDIYLTGAVISRDSTISAFLTARIDMYRIR